ncbi:TPA: hypothetical protein EYP44_00665 [Candidatus Bathyarchaeota archaeon]|nr:hypothetical protein [Candidatus Bathyarchaeota archaeon]
MKIAELVPGMDGVTVRARVLSLSGVRERATRRGVRRIVEGEIEDDTGRIRLVVWDERVHDLASVSVSDTIHIVNGFVSSFKGVKELNVGRLGRIRKRVG